MLRRAREEVYIMCVFEFTKLARIEVELKDFNKVIDDDALVKEIKKLGFDYVTLDLEGITSGSYDR